MLLNNFKERLDEVLAFRVIGEELAPSLYDVATDWVEEHHAEAEQRLIRVKDGWGKNCAALQVEFYYPECTYYITVEAEDYKYTEFMEPRHG